MRDWKAAARGWVARDKDSASDKGLGKWNNLALDYQQRDYTDDDFTDLFVDLEHYGETVDVKQLK